MYDSIYITYVGANDNIDFSIVGMLTGNRSVYCIIRRFNCIYRNYEINLRT